MNLSKLVNHSQPAIRPVPQLASTMSSWSSWLSDKVRHPAHTRRQLRLSHRPIVPPSRLSRRLRR